MLNDIVMLKDTIMINLPIMLAMVRHESCFAVEHLGSVLPDIVMLKDTIVINLPIMLAMVRHESCFAVEHLGRLVQCVE